MNDTLIISSDDGYILLQDEANPEIIEFHDVGPIGPIGPMGHGMPTGGMPGQFIAKHGLADYDFEWLDVPASDRLVKGAYAAVLGADGILQLSGSDYGYSGIFSSYPIDIYSNNANAQVTLRAKGTNGDNSLVFDNSGHLEVPGTVTHQGLEPSTGVNIDQILTFTKSLTVDNNWQDTGIGHLDLTTGTYLIQLYANDLQAGGSSNNEYYSGICSWYDGLTDSVVELPTDEIVLHRAGISGNASLFLRTYATPGGSQEGLKLQIYSNNINSSSANYVFKFRRII